MVSGVVAPVAIDRAHWHERLCELAGKHRVPGAVLGILRLGRSGEEQVEVGCGLLNTATGVEVTVDSLFQIGSIAKPFTATVAMGLVEEGRLDLDQPVVEVLPELRLSDPVATGQVTLRHLLTHTSGIDGDVFTDTGRGDDALARYVAQLHGVAQNFPVGATWSYCNTGFSVLGRMVEKVTGQVWESALRARLLDPLGLSRTATFPEEALLHRAAVGHLATGDGGQRPTPVWCMERAGSPAGSILAMSVGDLLTFTRMHLNGGCGRDGTAILGEETVALMRQRHADMPTRYGIADSWGLGWMLWDWDGEEVFGHGGNTLGQHAGLRVLPGHGLAVAVLTNGGHRQDLFNELYPEVFAELAGVSVPAPLTPPMTESQLVPGGADFAGGGDLSAHIGRYEIAGMVAEVSARGSGFVLALTDTSEFADLSPDPEEELVLHPVSQDMALIREPEEVGWEPVSFCRLPSGQRFMHLAGRSFPLTPARATASD